MKLKNEAIQSVEQWKDKGYALPEYDRSEVTEATKAEPTWLHLGAGNIFRAFPAMLNHRLLNEGKMNKGIIVGEGFDYEIIEKAYRPYDELSLLVTLKADGSVDKTVVGSVVESLRMDSANEEEFSRLKEIFTADSLQMVSFTITEKGYSLVNARGEVMGSVKEDFEKGPDKPVSYMGKLTALLYERYKNGAKPIALVSMDNASHNGALLQKTVTEFVDQWVNAGVMDKGFKDYVNDTSKVTFPWSMIDKITPRPDADVQSILKEDGFEDADTIITDKNTYTAPFVNAEEAEYLVIEDTFPNGRPPLEEAGVIFTDRETVDKAETMKVTTCLNPLHTALAIYGCLLRHTSIHEEMNDTELKALIEKIGYEEGLPVVVDPEILDPKSFIDEVINVRFPNPFMPDTPQRIATDTSQKLSIRYGKTMQAYIEARDKDVRDLTFIPLVLAGWLRYLMQVDDKGTTFELSPDPLLDELTPLMDKIELGDNEAVEDKLKPILSRKDIFGVDLYRVGLADKVTGYFKQLNEGPGAIRETLKQTLANV
ncbi:fructuronate reductase [Alkalibacterium putridalgicola]|uniref:Fructuronate reductase n=1 Tax=Alkalibacterium putridalgicola TaxID=426703 RepID=A0A1H7R8M5_9LACT|nr:mannitol dehydrogenase family protein [Alkalibacterium putridalgicola]GEK88856.1 mannitol dehydrogenase [Alkalibacterium putridalgicola]SEL56543.1 fructuronate reductase [Alkalibacterium putridalgicola]